MKKSFLTCSSILVVALILAVVVIFVGIRAFNNLFRASLLEKLGFSSESEYNDFVEIMNTPFDETTFYQNTYSNDDIEYVKSELTANITLNDGSDLFYDNGYLNIEALDIDDNTTILNSMQFTPSQFAYFQTLLLQSLFVDSSTEIDSFGDIKMLSFELTSATSCTVILYLNATELKELLGDFSEALPNKLYITLKYDIIDSTTDDYKATNESIQFNNLNETYNNKCINLLRAVLQTHPATFFAELAIALVNSFDTTTQTKTIFNESLITIGGIQ